MSRFLGLDVSLRRTGVWVIDEGQDGVQHIPMHIEPLPSGVRGVRRLWSVLRGFENILTDFLPFHGVAIEGYSYRSRSNASFEIGELGGLIKMALHEAQAPFLVVPPQTMKKFIVGRAGPKVNKQDVIAECQRQTGLLVRDDEADAWALAVMAKAWATGDVNGFTKSQRECLTKCKVDGLQGRGRSAVQKRRFREWRKGNEGK